MIKQKKISKSITFDDPSSYDQTYEKVVQEEGDSQDPLERLILDEYVGICKEIEKSSLQESWCWRNVHLARELSFLLIDEKGELNKEELLRAIMLLKQNLFSLGPDRHHDAPRRKELLNLLERLYTDEKLISELKKVSKPMGHQNADRLIRETLLMRTTEIVTDVHARRAVLSALLTKLRQNVGSCFATAPAILIQQEQPDQFLSDMVQLLGTGRLKRVYGGDEYAVPLSLSWGIGDLQRPFLLSSIGEDPCRILSQSPGLLSAFHAAGILEELPKEEKQQWCERLLHLSPYLRLQEDPFVFLTPDQIIHSVLLQFYELTANEVENYRNFSREGIVGEFVLHVPQAKEGKSLAVFRFLKSYEQAKGAFKAVADNALLKAWEFTLASLSETKGDFASWNLSKGLGLHPEEEEGIGEALYKLIQEKIDSINQEILDYQSRCEYVFAQLKSLEGRIGRASTENEIGWIRAEYQTRKFEYHRLTVERDELHEKGRMLAQLFPILLSFYSEKFKEYFQEIYDAEMHDVSVNLYDDSPAGFRLLYKHGRSNTSLWTLISTPVEFINALSSFFTATEIELAHLPQTKGLESDLSQLVTALFTHIRRPEFLESCFARLARAYGERLISNPLDHLSQVQRKPWAYISGGTMATLVNCYYGSSKKIEEKVRWVENETELLVFLLDVIKELPRNIQKEIKKKEESLLAFSPTHAFLCKPSLPKFRKGWENDVYTYTWVRDQWILPQQKFLSSLNLDFRMMDVLVDEIAKMVPIGYRPRFKSLFGFFTHPMVPSEFREYVLKTISYERWLQAGNRLDFLSVEIDSCLYKCLPLFPDYQLKEKLELLFDTLPDVGSSLKNEIFLNITKVENAIGRYKIFTADDLRRVAKTLLLSITKKSKSSHPYHQLITETMQNTGLSLSAPVIFADTNWVKNTFGFTVNPGTAKLELWRFDDCGSEGHPMIDWRNALNGSDRREWGLYINPHQYRSR